MTDLINTIGGVTYAADGTPQMPMSTGFSSAKSDPYTNQPYADRCLVLIGHEKSQVGNFDPNELNKIIQLITHQHASVRAGGRIITNVPRTLEAQQAALQMGFTPRYWQTNGEAIEEQINNSIRFPSSLWMAQAEETIRKLASESERNPLLEEYKTSLSERVRILAKEQMTCYPYLYRGNFSTELAQSIIEKGRRNDAENSERYFDNKVDDYIEILNKKAPLSISLTDYEGKTVKGRLVEIESGLTSYVRQNGEIVPKRELSLEELATAKKYEHETTLAILSPDGKVLVSGLMYFNHPDQEGSYVEAFIDRPTHPYNQPNIKKRKFMFLNWFGAPGKTEYDHDPQKGTN